MKPIIVFAVVSLLVSSARSQIIWNFGTTTGDLSPSSNSLSNVTVSTVSGTNLGTALNTTTSPSSGYVGASGNFNIGGAAAAGAFNASTSSYFAFTLTPDAGYQLQITGISFASRSTATGPLNLAIRTSGDAFVSHAGSATVSNNSSWALISPSLTSITATSALTIRIYGFDGSSASSGNWRLDDLTVTGTVSAIPEPSTYAAIAGAAALIGATYYRRRRSG